MAFEALIGRAVSALNRRLLRFPPAPAGVALPAPDADRRYLLYLHVPFCIVLCPFCSFHRVQYDKGSATSYFAALRTEIERNMMLMGPRSIADIDESCVRWRDPRFIV